MFKAVYKYYMAETLRGYTGAFFLWKNDKGDDIINIKMKGIMNYGTYYYIREDDV